MNPNDQWYEFDVHCYLTIEACHLLINQKVSSFGQVRALSTCDGPVAAS